MRNICKRAIALGFAALTLSACAGDADVEDTTIGDAEPAMASYPYAAWDTDRNQMLTDTEFRTVASERGYTRWNTNNDTGIDRDEFGTGLFGLWDRDRNNELTEQEWRDGAGRWYGADGNFGEFSAWDTNRDGMLDMNEYNLGIGTTGYYDRWDADRNSFVDENEFGTGLFSTWDTNRDSNIDANEWDFGAGGVDWF